MLDINGWKVTAKKYKTRQRPTSRHTHRLVDMENINEAPWSVFTILVSVRCVANGYSLASIVPVLHNNAW